MFTKKSTVLFGIFVVVIALLALTTNSVHAAPLGPFPVTVTQPDGTELTLYAVGDEYYNWLQDAQGYTVIQDPVSGYYVYADFAKGKLVPTKFVVGRADPASAGLHPYLNISPEQKSQIRQASLDQTKKSVGEISNAPTTGTINNLVIFIRFSGESEFTTPLLTYTNMLNDSTAGANSLRNYYQEVSYNALTINSTLYPTPGATVVSYQNTHPRSYFQPYNAVTNPGGYTTDIDSRLREHALLRDAVDYINNVLVQFPSAASIDADGDGIVDSVTFIVSGSPDGWSDLLWPHQWNLYSYTVTINGKTVGEYSFQLNSMLYTGVLAHETFHVLGSPDLYHYSGDGLQPVGAWDVMENDQDPPQHMGCYMKFMYGHWISSIPELTATGTHTINPLGTSSTGNCYQIPSPYSATEYFVVEYRNATGAFESSLPGTGLLVYRINTLATGNADGPPDEVYIYRPGGTTSVDGSVNTANFSSNVGRTAINDATDPSSFLTNGSVGGLNLCNIGASGGTTMSFDICASSVFAIRGNAGVGGATLTYTGGSTTANGSGLYSIVVPSGWSGTVTPSKTDYTFTPDHMDYSNVLATKTEQNYTAIGPVNLLQDPSFEDYSPNPHWTEFSTNYGTPLCTTGDCGSGGGTAGPLTGSVWGWFGGTTLNETGSLSQTVTIPTGAATLKFYFWIGSADIGSDASDVFTAKIDGVTVFSANATQLSSYPVYKLVSVDVSAYANGAAHTVMFSSVTTGQTVNFNLDDVALLFNPSSWVGSVSITSDKNVVAIGRPHIGSEVASYSGFSTGALTAYIPMLFKTAFDGTYDSALYVQNVDSSVTANVSIKYYDSSTGALTCTDTDTIKPLASKGYWLPTLPAAECLPSGLPAGWVGSAVVTSSTTAKIVANGRPHIGGEVMTYDSFSSGSLTSYLPMLFNGAYGGGYNSAFYVQNVSPTVTAAVTIKYYNSATGALTCTDTDAILPNTSKGYWLPTLSAAECLPAGLPAGWVGGVVVTSTAPIVTVGRPHVGTQITTYNGFAAGGLSSYVPMLFRKAYGGTYDSALYVQNVGAVEAAITIKYYKTDGTLTCTDMETIAPLASKGYWLPTLSAAECTGGLPDDWVGGVVVTSTTANIVAIGRPHIGTQVTTYNGFSSGSGNSYLPMLFKNMWGYDSAFYVQNTNAAGPASVTIRFYDVDGNLSCARSDSIPALSTKGYWVPSVLCVP